MKTLRRLNFKDCTYFITCNTYRRQGILLKNPVLFQQCWKMHRPIAWAMMPEHFHILLECGNHNISDIMHNFKIAYSRHYRDKYGPGKIWQNRFWDHIIRDQEDMNRHLDYIHYNPVKHGLVKDPFLYEHSSLKNFYEQDFYRRNWGKNENIDFEDEFGE